MVELPGLQQSQYANLNQRTCQGGTYMCKNIKFLPRRWIFLVTERIRIRFPLDELLPCELIQVFQTTVTFV